MISLQLHANLFAALNSSLQAVLLYAPQEGCSKTYIMRHTISQTTTVTACTVWYNI
jgi:hypothetical protein